MKLKRILSAFLAILTILTSISLSVFAEYNGGGTGGGIFGEGDWNNSKSGYRVSVVTPTGEMMYAPVDIQFSTPNASLIMRKNKLGQAGSGGDIPAPEGMPLPVIANDNGSYTLNGNELRGWLLGDGSTSEGGGGSGGGGGSTDDGDLGFGSGSGGGGSGSAGGGTSPDEEAYQILEKNKPVLEYSLRMAEDMAMKYGATFTECINYLTNAHMQAIDIAISGLSEPLKGIVTSKLGTYAAQLRINFTRAYDSYHRIYLDEQRHENQNKSANGLPVPDNSNGMGNADYVSITLPQQKPTATLLDNKIDLDKSQSIPMVRPLANTIPKKADDSEDDPLDNTEGKYGKAHLKFMLAECFGEDAIEKIRATDCKVLIEPVFWFTPRNGNQLLNPNGPIYGTITNINEYYVSDAGWMNSTTGGYMALLSNDAGPKSLILTAEDRALGIAKPENVTGFINDGILSQKSPGWGLHIYSKGAGVAARTTFTEWDLRKPTDPNDKETLLKFGKIKVIKVYEYDTGEHIETKIKTDYCNSILIQTEPEYDLIEWKKTTSDVSASSSSSWDSVSGYPTSPNLPPVSGSSGGMVNMAKTPDNQTNLYQFDRAFLFYKHLKF